MVFSAQLKRLKEDRRWRYSQWEIGAIRKARDKGIFRLARRPRTPRRRYSASEVGGMWKSLKYLLAIWMVVSRLSHKVPSKSKMRFMEWERG